MPKSITSVFKKIFYNILDTVLPSVCVNCEKESYMDELLCKRCFQSIIINKSPKRIGNYFLFSATDYKNPAVNHLIKIMKYNGVWKASKLLSEIIMSHLDISGFNQFIEKENIFIAPIPLHFIKKWQRGFNQSEILAKIIGKNLNIPVFSIIKRKKMTFSQSKLSNDFYRSLNISGCFSLSDSAVKIPPKSTIIILDDVVTSGETIKEAAKTLKPLLPRKIIYLSAASR